MAKKLSDYIASLPPERQQRIKQISDKYYEEEMTLRELREARKKSQRELGERLHIKQAAVSKLERRTDIYLSTLRSFIQATGGELEIIATYPDRSPVKINHFKELQGSMIVEEVTEHEGRALTGIGVRVISHRPIRTHKGVAKPSGLLRGEKAKV